MSVRGTQYGSVTAELKTYHGCVTDQWRKTPARPSSMMSVTIAPPFLKSAPEMAGSSANANDSEAKEDDSGSEDSALVVCRACGLRMSRASFRLYSEKLELLRGGGGGGSKDESDEKRLVGVRLRVGSSDSSTVLARRKACPAGALIPELTAPEPALALALLVVALPLPAACSEGRRTGDDESSAIADLLGARWQEDGARLEATEKVTCRRVAG